MKDNKVLSSKNSKNIILIIMLLVVLIGIGTFLITKFSGKRNVATDLSDIYDSNKPIIVKDNGKYGYITSEGKNMIKVQYDNANDFHGEYAMVRVGNSYQIIDKEGNVKISVKEKSKYYEDYNIWIIDEVLYDSKLNQVLPDGYKVKYENYGYLSYYYESDKKKESGIVTYKGKKIFVTATPVFDFEISENEYNEEELYAKVFYLADDYSPEEMIVVSLKTGDVLFTAPKDYYIAREDNGIFICYPEDDEIEKDEYLYFRNDKLVFRTTEKVYDIEVYDYQNQILEIEYGSDYESLGKKQEYYYYDVKNKKMLEEEPDTSITIDDFKDILSEQTYGFKEYSSSGKYGLMSGEKIIVPCEYDGVEHLNKNVFSFMKSKGKELVFLEKNDKTLLYNLKDTKTIVTFASKAVSDYKNSTFLSAELREKDSYKVTGYMVYNLLSGKSMTFEKADDVTVGSNYIIVEKDHKHTYYNTDLKQIYEVTVS